MNDFSLGQFLPVLRRARLQTRLTLLVLATALPVLVIAAVFLSNQARTQLDASLNEQIRLVNSALKANVAIWLDLNTQTLRQLVLQPDIISMDASRQKPHLVAVAKAHSHLYLVMTTNLEGVNVARNDDEAPKNYSDRKYFQQARAGIPATEVLISRTTGRPALGLSAPIQDASGRIVGVGAIFSELKEISQQVNVSQVGKTGVTYIVDGANRIVAHSDPQVLMNAKNELIDATQFPPVVYLRQGKRGYLPFTDSDGVRWLAYVDKLDNEWGVIIQQQESELLSAVQTFQRTSWITIVAGVVIMLSLVWLSIWRSLRPIGALTQTASAIAAGDLTRIAPVSSEDEIGTLARAFNRMTEQLRGLITGLEQRVAERTAEISQANEQLSRQANRLQASAQVSRAATTLLDPDQLIPRVVELIQQRFGFYYVGLFLADQDNRYAVLEAGTGEAGRIMKERGHRLEIGGQSMVGWTCANRKARIALDVGREAVRFANPLLPATRSEMALPLQVGERVLGALTVQSDQPSAFDEGDTAALQGMADQIAVALENARLFRQTQAALQELEQTNRLLVREGWEGYQQRRMEIPRAEFRTSDIPGADALPEAVLIPLELRGQPIGQLTVRRESERPWSDEEMEMIRAIALQTALAADNARLVEQTQLALQETEGLFEATRTIAGLTQITDICQSLADYANTLEQADHTLVILADIQRRQIFARAGAGHSESELDLTFEELEASIAGQVLRTGEPVLSGSAGGGLKPGRRQQPDVGSLIVAPLAIKGQVVGVISVANRPDQRQFAQHDVELILALAGPAATALENVRLLEATQRRAERERLIRQITTRVRAATDIESVLETTASELAHTLGVPRTIVRLTTGDGAKG